MNQFTLSAVAIAIGLALGTGAMAQTMSKENYKVGKGAIAAEYKSAKLACKAVSGNARDICKAEAGGREKVARAELEAKYRPSRDTGYKVRVARADADYAVAREKCDDLAGNVKDVCVKEARAVSIAAQADAKAQRKVSDANQAAAATSAKAMRKANDQGIDARADAAADKRNADYAVAIEKCDDLAGDAKSACVKAAKVRFGKS